MTRRGNITTTWPTCAHCGQRIAFITMTDTGRRLPIDPHPVADGNVCATPVGRGLKGYVIADNRPPLDGWRRYAAHFGTCPQRARPGQPGKLEQRDLFDGA